MARRDRTGLRSAAPAAGPDDEYDDYEYDSRDRGGRGGDRYADDEYDDRYDDEYDDGYEYDDEYDDYDDEPEPRRRTFDPDAVGPFDVEDLEAPTPDAGADDNVDPKEYERLHNGGAADDDFRDDPAHAAWAREILTGLTDFGAVRIPVPADGNVDLTVPPSGTMQAVHVLIPQGKLSVSALAAPRSEELWPTLASEIEASLRDGGATVRQSSGQWGLELHAHTDVAGSVFVGVDGPRWMVYGVATGPQASAAELDAALRLMLRGMIVVRGRLPYPPRTVLPLELPEDLKLRQEEQVAAAEKAKAAGEVVPETPEPRALPTTAIPVRPTPPRPPQGRRPAGPRPPQGPGRRPDGHPGAGPRPLDPARRPAANGAGNGTGPNRPPFDGRAAAFRPAVDGRPGGVNGGVNGGTNGVNRGVNGTANGAPVNGHVNGGPVNGGVNGAGVNGTGAHRGPVNGSVNGSAPNGAVNGNAGHGIDGTAAYRPATNGHGPDGSADGTSGSGANGVPAGRGTDGRSFDGPPPNARPVDGPGRPDTSGFAPGPDSGRHETPRRRFGDAGPVDGRGPSPRDARPAAAADRPYAGDSGRVPARGSDTGAYGTDSGAFRRDADSGAFRRDDVPARGDSGAYRRPADSGAFAPRDDRPVRRDEAPARRDDVPARPAAELTGGHRAPGGTDSHGVPGATGGHRAPGATGGHRAPDPTGGYRAVPPTGGRRAEVAVPGGVPTPPRAYDNRGGDPIAGRPFDGPPRTGRRAADDGRSAFRPPAGARPGGRRRAEDRDDRSAVDPQTGLSAGAPPPASGRRAAPESGSRHGSTGFGEFGSGAYGLREPASRADRAAPPTGGHRVPLDRGVDRAADRGRHGTPAAGPLHGGSSYEHGSEGRSRDEPEPYGRESYGGDANSGSYSGDSYGRDSFSAGPHGQDAYRADAYRADAYRADTYRADTYRGDSYRADSYRADSYGTDSYGGDSYRAGSYRGDSYTGDPYSEGSYGRDAAPDQEPSGRHGRPRRHSAEDMEGSPALAFLNGDPSRMFDGDDEPYPAGRHHRPR